MNALVPNGRWRASGLVSVALLILLPSCRPTAQSPQPVVESPRAPLVEGVIVTTIASAEVDPAASAQEGDTAICRQWTVTAPQAEALITRSHEIDAQAYQRSHRGSAPCRIGGLVRREGRTWQFTIDTAAQVMLKRGNEVKYLGCDAQACRSLAQRVPARSPTR
ncbi:hypothetical protein ACFPN1_01745 [Lysobacter yangpyeongensis]|uniref:DUF3617 family protein n=1 Tax=Lysobacter yangpyeongensis TaxID=346182 RepID=A0ABW0SIC1_9GAMM